MTARRWHCIRSGFNASDHGRERESSGQLSRHQASLATDRAARRATYRESLSTFDGCDIQYNISTRRVRPEQNERASERVSFAS